MLSLELREVARNYAQMSHSSFETNSAFLTSYGLLRFQDCPSACGEPLFMLGAPAVFERIREDIRQWRYSGTFTGWMDFGLDVL